VETKWFHNYNQNIYGVNSENSQRQESLCLRIGIDETPNGMATEQESDKSS